MLGEGRLELLDELVEVDRVRRYLTKEPKNYALYDRLLTGLYTVIVLLSEDWRRRADRTGEVRSCLSVGVRK